MGKHKRHRMAERAAQESARENAQPWYTTAGFKIGAGIFGIIIVIGMFFLVNNALDTPPGNPGTAPTAAGATAELDASGSQVIRMGVGGYQYNPDTFTVQQNVPVKFIVDGSEASGCTSYIVSRELGFSQRLARGENVIEFTPTRKGSFGFACGMNMVSGTINVV